MPADLIAHIGFATSVLEAAAAAIGTGVVVGGFVAAASAMLAGRLRTDVERNALRDSFFGGAVGILCLLWDAVLR